MALVDIDVHCLGLYGSDVFLQYIDTRAEYVQKCVLVSEKIQAERHDSGQSTGFVFTDVHKSWTLASVNAIQTLLDGSFEECFWVGVLYSDGRVREFQTNADVFHKMDQIGRHLLDHTEACVYSDRDFA